jgi:hypothetical protein
MKRSETSQENNRAGRCRGCGGQTFTQQLISYLYLSGTGWVCISVHTAICTANMPSLDWTRDSRVTWFVSTFSRKGKPRIVNIFLGNNPGDEGGYILVPSLHNTNHGTIDWRYVARSSIHANTGCSQVPRIFEVSRERYNYDHEFNGSCKLHWFRTDLLQLRVLLLRTRVAKIVQIYSIIYTQNLAAQFWICIQKSHVNHPR